jgi:hypothetical protein
LKNSLNKEGSKTATKCKRLKMVAEDGEMRLTCVADPETLIKKRDFGSKQLINAEK